MSKKVTSVKPKPKRKYEKPLIVNMTLDEIVKASMQKPKK
jgi:hypothetical protein